MTRRKSKQISIERVNNEVDVRLEKLDQVLNTLQDDKPKPKLKKSPPKKKSAGAEKEDSTIVSPSSQLLDSTIPLTYGNRLTASYSTGAVRVVLVDIS